MRSRRGRLVWILLAVAVLLLVVAAVAVGLHLVLRRQPESGSAWKDPIAEVVSDAVMADWALYPLAGASELETIDRAIASGDLETAYAVIVFSLDLSDAQRIGRLSLLAERFTETNALDRAMLCYQQVYDTAVLSPALSDPVRADVLLGCGRGLAALEQTSLALDAYDQVLLLASQSPYLQAAQRRDLLSSLGVAYRELGEEGQSKRCDERILELEQESKRPAALVQEAPDLPAFGDPVSSTEVGELEEIRREQAYALRESLSGGGQAPSDLVAGLAGALVAEDLAKLALYEREMDETSQLGARINVHWHTIRWLTLKYQVASKGLGLSLVPDWEAQLPDIQSALSKAFEGLFFEYEDLVTALPEASLMGPGSYEVRRAITLAGRLGQYPNYGDRQMADKLSDAVTNLIASGSVEQLYVDSVFGEDGLRFFFSPADEYGKPAQSP